VRSTLALAIFLVATFSAGAVGAMFMPGAWYEALAKPSWTPPNWLFGPVWTALYILIAVSAWLVWREVGLSAARLALALFAAQLFLNALWSWLFFGLERPGLALIDILLLEAAIVWMIVTFWPLSRLAGMMLIPYLIWVSFATLLNAAIWRLNA
jgi:tryptophan-rich sensory protein